VANSPATTAKQVFGTLDARTFASTCGRHLAAAQAVG